MPANEPPTSDGAGAAPVAEPRLSPSPVRWMFAGVALTLLVVLTLRWLDEGPSGRAVASAEPSASRFGLAPPPSAEREQFAQLYLSYLLRTYYVDARGYCAPLLARICQALLSTSLLDDPLSCEGLPNDAFVLAIGRFQHRVGLPVDGKAGPETVRMMLGGDFSSRQGMAAQYCQR